jgi:hypothetical protein
MKFQVAYRLFVRRRAACVGRLNRAWSNQGDRRRPEFQVASAESRSTVYDDRSPINITSLVRNKKCPN